MFGEMNNGVEPIVDVDEVVEAVDSDEPQTH